MLFIIVRGAFENEVCNCFGDLDSASLPTLVASPGTELAYFVEIAVEGSVATTWNWLIE